MSAIKVTPELKAQGKKIAKELGVNTLHVNTKGEFFTRKDYALLSEKNDAEKVEELSFAEESPAENTEVSAEQIAAQKAVTAAKGVLTKAKKALGKAKGDDVAAAQTAVTTAEEALKEAESALAVFTGE